MHEPDSISFERETKSRKRPSNYFGAWEKLSANEEEAMEKARRELRGHWNPGNTK